LNIYKWLRFKVGLYCFCCCLFVLLTL